MEGCEVNPDMPNKDMYHGGSTRHADIIHTVNRNIDDIGTSGGRGKHTCSCNTSSVVRVDMDWKVGMGFPNGTNQSVRQRGKSPLTTDGS